MKSRDASRKGVEAETKRQDADKQIARLTGGLQRSDLIILAARPAVGKTSFALSLAHNASIKHKRSIAVFSLEMSKEQLLQRFLSPSNECAEQPKP